MDPFVRSPLCWVFPSILSTVPLNIGFSLIRSFLCLPCSRPWAGSPHFCSSCCLELLPPWLIYSRLLRLTSRVIFLSKPAFSALAGARKFPSRGQASLVTAVRRNSLWDSLKGSGFVLLVFLSPGSPPTPGASLSTQETLPWAPTSSSGRQGRPGDMFPPRPSLFIGCLVWMVKSLLLVRIVWLWPP